MKKQAMGQENLENLIKNHTASVIRQNSKFKICDIKSLKWIKY